MSILFNVVMTMLTGFVAAWAYVNKEYSATGLFVILCLLFISAIVGRDK